ncbi:MAG: epoxyqueuosine reductase QueH [Campylobacterota bacterium]|nr:epoxyqueuosine reductase QueH [Campylobacterota bacterium]
MLVHICCSVDSHYFLQKLQEDYPNETFVGFFYDPNIQPYSEYALRFLDVQYSCEKLGIELLEGEYDFEGWLKLVKGLEQEPEKGDRCTVCFDNRLRVTAQKALELGEKSFTTTLLISPKKSQDKLETIGQELQKEFGLQWIFKDYRTGNGTQLQGEIVKENSLYRQNYCGCLFGLMPQREYQDKLMDEMISPIGGQILSESIEERLALYHLRNEYEKNGKSYKVIKQRFLNYRLLSAWVKVAKVVIPSYILNYSTLQNGKTNGRIEYTQDGVSHLNRNEVKIVSLKHVNKRLNTSYKNVLELIFNPLSMEDESTLRLSISKNGHDLSTIVILDKIVDAKYELQIDAKIYEDVKEVLIPS